MNELVTRCQCSRWRHACQASMTAEDLLCDSCRKGCGEMELNWPSSEPITVHVYISPDTFTWGPLVPRGTKT